MEDTGELRMKIMVTMTFDPSRRAEIMQHIPAEQIRVRELQAAGTLDALYIERAGNHAWLVLNVAGEEEAHRVMESLPLHAYATLDLAPLAVQPG
jgi:muconolactone delta-isomerase